MFIIGEFINGVEDVWSGDKDSSIGNNKTLLSSVQKAFSTTINDDDDEDEVVDVEVAIINIY